jgi:hypothetical protein
VFITTDAKTEPIAMVEAKSKLDILAKVRKPETRVIKMITAKITMTESNTFPSIGNDAYTQFSIIFLFKLRLKVL